MNKLALLVCSMCLLVAWSSTCAALPNPHVRSAYLLRDPSAATLAPATNAEIREDLQRHFDLVLWELCSNTPENLSVALDRWREADNQVWTDVEVRERRQQLLENRIRNIGRLIEYRKYGQFPLNQESDRPMPIFVDQHDTACAVGYLMRKSGWQAEVQAIAGSQNNVYVSDVFAGPIIDWVITSGFTKEEACLIQPAYQPPDFDASLDELLQPGASISEGGVRYENFSWMSSLDSGPWGASAQEGTFQSPDGSVLVPTLSHWMFFGVDGFSDVVRVPAGERQTVRLQFDAVAENPGTAIDAAGITSNANFSFNFLEPGGQMQISATMEHGGETTSVALSSDGIFLNGTDIVEFDATGRVAVDSLITIDGPADFTSMIFEFNLVPEPHAFSAWFIGLLAIAVLGRRRRRE